MLTVLSNQITIDTNKYLDKFMMLESPPPKKSILFTAPSGAGKSTLIAEVIEKFPQFSFSISATTRAPRADEKHGSHYYFLSIDAFRENIKQDNFLEWEEVYKGLYYGTLKEEMTRIQSIHRLALFDLDVKGAKSIKKKLGHSCLTIFICPPSLRTLEKRLRQRGTEEARDLKKRMNRASFEMTFSQQFDYCLVNNELNVAKKEVIHVVHSFLNNHL